MAVKMQDFLAYRKQLDLIVWLQGAVGVKGGFLCTALRAVSLLACGEAFMALSALTLALYDAQIGFELFRQLCLALLVMSTAKTFFASPRPFFVSKKVKQLDPTTEVSYGFPSGHVVTSTSLYGLLAAKSDSTAVHLLYGAAVATMMVSRVFTGAHFVHDVVGGLLLGGLVLWASLTLPAHLLDGEMLLVQSLVLGLTVASSYNGNSPQWRKEAIKHNRTHKVTNEHGSDEGHIELPARLGPMIQAGRVREALEGTGLCLGLGLGRLFMRAHAFGTPTATAPVHLLSLGIGLVITAALFALHHPVSHNDEHGFRPAFHTVLCLGCISSLELLLSWGIPCVIEPIVASYMTQ